LVLRDLSDAEMDHDTVLKLFIDSEPGGSLAGAGRDFCRTWPSQTQITVTGSHFLQEDSPDEIGTAIAEWYRHTLTRP
jgi:haloalkane dehalogenase